MKSKLTQKPIFPFTAIVGQERMKRALLVNALDPAVGGVLIRGEKGTAKSTAVRAVAALLPRIAIVRDCVFSCDPTDVANVCLNCSERLDKRERLESTERQVRIVELPVGATEDRVIGTLNLEKAIQRGERIFEPGLLAIANRGILYVDEVNLLSDHLVDILLDVAAMGTNFVEREGISYWHPSHFLLVGTMNPEEGDLRPQLLDRFGLCVEVDRIEEQKLRMEVVKRRIDFESDPVTFLQHWQETQEREQTRITEAKNRLPFVKLSSAMLQLITQICSDFKVDGLRADIVMFKCARALAAYAGRNEVDETDIKEAAELALLHRQRRRPFEEPRLDREQLERSIERNRESQQNPQKDPTSSPYAPTDEKQVPEENDGPTQTATQEDHIFEVGSPFQVTPLNLPLHDQIERSKRGRRSKTRTKSRSGYYVGARPPEDKPQDLAFDATVRASAPYQKQRRANVPDSTALIIHRSDLREKVRESKTSNLILFVVDASGSMGAHRRMVATKGAILSMLLDAYQRRDQIGLITFRGEQAIVALPPTNSVENAERCLRKLPTGGRTPLSHALHLAAATLERHRFRDAELDPLLVLVSDGRANVAMEGIDAFGEAKQLANQLCKKRVRSVVIDTETGFLRFGLAKQISEALGGRYLVLEELEARPLARAVQQIAN